MGNAFTELNDPIEQQKRFEAMQELYRDDEEEAHPVDRIIFGRCAMECRQMVALEWESIG